MNMNLPIYVKKNEIIEAIRNHDTVIISAETGSGKSTQVPQYLFEEGFDVIVTQPRRIACVSLAQRVTEEMMCDEGIICYHTAFESNRTDDSKVVFCTDGLQLAKGIKKEEVENTVLVLDEVHEWNLNIETLIAWVKKFREQGNRLKVIVMSATIDIDPLAKFFGSDSVVVEVDGRVFPVETHYIETSRWDEPEASTKAFKNLISEQVALGKNILVFESGKSEINKRASQIEEIETVKNSGAVIIKLHGDLSYANQKECFKHYNVPKIVIATNIAQTSLTISDIDVVIDFGTEKRIEIYNGIEGLVLHNISQSDCKQRAGRAGRTHAGDYYLISDTDVKYRDEYPTPEIKRMMLDRVVLKLLSVDIDAEDIEFFHQPATSLIRLSKKLLNNLGAIKDGKITTVGQTMVKMPVSSRSAKILMLSADYGQWFLSQMIIITSIIEGGRSILNFGLKDKDGIPEYVEYRDFVHFDDNNVHINKSDLFYEFTIYYGIENGNIDKADRRINMKVYNRIKEYIEKLEEVAPLYLDIPEYDMNIDDTNAFCDLAVSVIVRSFLDNIYIEDYRDTYYNINDMDYVYNRTQFRLSKNTATSLFGTIAIGLPKMIEFKNRWGERCTMNILDFVTRLRTTELYEVIPELFEKEENMDEIQYFEGEFIIPVYYKYKSVKVSGQKHIVKEGDDLYEELKEKYSHLVDKYNDKFVKLGDKLYDVHESGWTIKEHVVYLSMPELFELTDISTARTQSGKQIKFSVEGNMNNNLNILRDKLALRALNRELDESIEMAIYNSQFPNRTGSFVKISEEVDKEDSVIKEFYASKYGYQESRYIGFAIDGNALRLQNYPDKPTWEEKTLESLKFIFGYEAKQRHPEKTFFERIKGKKTMSNKSKKQYQEYLAFVSNIIENLDKDSFTESMELVDEMYGECISELKQD